MTPDSFEIVKLKNEQIRPAGDCLAEIFWEDPGSIHGFPNQNRRKDYLKYPFRGIVRYGVKYGNAYAIVPKSAENAEISLTVEEGKVFSAVAVVARIEKMSRFNWDFIRCGLNERILSIGLKAIRNYSALDRVMRENHKKYAPFPHYYLMAIGVRKNLRGKGLGGRLLRHIIADCQDTDPRLPIYLETELGSNVSFYEKFGFKLVGKTSAPNTKVKFWFMLLDPS